MADAATSDPHAADTPNPGVPAANPAANKAKRSKLFSILIVVVAIVGIVAAAWWFLIAAKHVSTDNAYVQAEVALITPRITGTLVTVPVHDTAHVKRGDILATLDPTDFQIAVDQAQADLLRAKQRVAQYFANVANAEAQVVSRKSDLDRARIDLGRRQSLAGAGAVSGDEITQARNALETARAALSAAEEQVRSQAALIKGYDEPHNPEVLSAQAMLDRAKVDLSRTVIRAPVDGVIAQNVAQLGQHVSPDAPLMAIVPISAVYVNANFKESQLKQIRPGLPVTLTSDLYGSSVVYHGRIVDLAGGTGSAFAVIPAQNATGNWIKVVQRLPVRIRLDPRELAQHPLRVGLSMDADVDISR
jgi:membrane fusion protein (multidrug efflux system)